MGLGQAYCQREYRKYSNITDKTMAGTMIVDYLPLLLSDEDNICTSLLLEGTQNEMQNETTFVSVYKLFAAIRDILFHIETNNITIDNIFPNQLDNTKLILSKLMQYRSYIEPNNKPNQANMYVRQMEEDLKVSYGDFYENKTIDKLVEDVLEWRSKYQTMLKTQNISAQLLQRIFTRSYFTMVNIDRNKHYTNVGEKINAYIIGFLNAVLVENAIENNCTAVNLNTSHDIDRIFKNNIASLNQEENNKLNQLKLYQWIISCPLLIKFINPFIKKIINEGNIDTNWELYKYSAIKNNIIIKRKKIQELNGSLKTIEQALKWLEKTLSPSNASSTEKSTQNFIGIYLTENHEKEIIYLDKDMETEKLQKNKSDLIMKRGKLFVNKYQIDEEIKNSRSQRKETASFIINDYNQYGDDLGFYKYLCSIEIKESKVLNYDSNINKDSL